MRRLLWCLIILAGCAWSGFMAVYIASVIPDPEVVGIAQTVVWVVFAGIVLLAFWMLPMLFLWGLAVLVKPVESVTIIMREIPAPERKEEASSVASSVVTPLFCQRAGMPKVEQPSEPCRIDGQVVAFRPRVQKTGN